MLKNKKEIIHTVLLWRRYTLQFSIAVSPSLTVTIVPLSSKKSAVNTPCLDFPPNNPSIQEDEEVFFVMELSSCIKEPLRFDIDRSYGNFNPFDLLFSCLMCKNVSCGLVLSLYILL